MKRFAIISLCVAAAVLCVSAGTGEYVPRVYYTIDENGQQSPMYFVDPNVMHRVRRSPQSGSSTSTSTSSGASTGAGGPLFFPQFGFGGFPGNGGFGGFPGNGGHYNQGGHPNQGTSTFTSTSTTSTNGGGGGGLDNRFGGDDTKVTGHTQTTNTHNGQFTQTSSHLGDDGKVHFSVQSGKF